MATDDAVLVGGPRTGTVLTAGDAALVELRIEGLVHRYIRTTRRSVVGEADLAIYSYDGVIDPDGAQDGVEHSADRAPIADPRPPQA